MKESFFHPKISASMKSTSHAKSQPKKLMIVSKTTNKGLSWLLLILLPSLKMNVINRLDSESQGHQPFRFRTMKTEWKRRKSEPPRHQRKEGSGGKEVVHSTLPGEKKERYSEYPPPPKELGGTTHCISQLHSYLHQKTAYGIGSSIANHRECGSLLSYRLHSVLI